MCPFVMFKEDTLISRSLQIAEGYRGTGLKCWAQNKALIFPVILREPQHICGAYPQIASLTPKWKEFRIINCWLVGPWGYFPGSVGKFLESWGAVKWGLKDISIISLPCFSGWHFPRWWFGFFLGCERTSQDHSFEEDDLFLLQLEDRL